MEQITKGKTVVLFKKKQCGSGSVYGLQMKLIDEVANATMEMDTRRIHDMFCHTNMVDAKKADTIDCQECKLSKAKQKKIAKVDKGKSERAGEKLCINTSLVNVRTGKKKF